jgi:hypothetical protein
MNYLELVNNVLIRLREDEVTAPTDTPYSKLISTFVNDAKRIVEDSFQWNVLTETLTVTTSADLFNYVLTGSGQRFRVMDVIHSEEDYYLEPKTKTHKKDSQLIITLTV